VKKFCHLHYSLHLATILNKKKKMKEKNNFVLIRDSEYSHPILLKLNNIEELGSGLIRFLINIFAPMSEYITIKTIQNYETN
jgi:hypothetical protein